MWRAIKNTFIKSKSSSISDSPRKQNDSEKSCIESSEALPCPSLSPEIQTQQCNKDLFGLRSSLQTLNTQSSGIGGSQDLLGSYCGSTISFNQVHHHHHTTYNYNTHHFGTQTSITEITVNVDNRYHDNSLHDASQTNIHNISDSKNVQIGDGNVMLTNAFDSKQDARDFQENSCTRPYCDDGGDEGDGYVIADMATPSSCPKASLGDPSCYDERRRPMNSNSEYGSDDYGTSRDLDYKMYGLNPRLGKSRMTSLSLDTINPNLQRVKSLNVILDGRTSDRQCAGRFSESHTRHDESPKVIQRPREKKRGSNFSLLGTERPRLSANNINELDSPKAVNQQCLLQRYETNRASLNEISKKRWEDLQHRRLEVFKKKAEFMSSPDVSGAGGLSSVWASRDKKKATSMATLRGPMQLYPIGESETTV